MCEISALCKTAPTHPTVKPLSLEGFKLMTVTRFAPSPTGWIHVGNLRAALFNFLIAKKAGGTFILRIDDTDPERSKEEYVDGIKRDLEWLGLEWDRVERQSLRLERYEAAAQELREKGRFYEAWETPTELDLKRKKLLNMGKPPVYDRAALALSEDEKAALRAERGAGVWRFKLDQERIEWNDGILGNVSIDAASVSDPVLIRADGQFLYTLASVVDDTDMGITYVVRGNDHVTNTATQIQMMEALGFKAPEFAHFSLLTGPGGEALSKRLGTLALKDLRENGVEPEALLSLMARLGSSQPVELKLSIDEIAEGWDLSQFGSAPTKFDAEDLYPLTAKKLHGLAFAEVADEVAALGVPADKAELFWSVVRENITTRKEMAEWWALFRDGAAPLVDDEDAEMVAQAFALLGEPPYDAGTWGAWTNTVKEATGRKGKGLFMPLRKAVTGRARGPEMADVMQLLSKKPG
jgi:glutamyl-tRNA synthetase